MSAAINPPGGAPIQSQVELSKEAESVGIQIITTLDTKVAKFTALIPFGVDKKHAALIQSLQKAGFEIITLPPTGVSIVPKESGAAAAVTIVKKVAGEVVSAAGQVLANAYAAVVGQAAA